MQEAAQEKHEFHELMSNYYRARNKLCGAVKDVSSLEDEINRHQMQIWAFPDKTVKVQVRLRHWQRFVFLFFLFDSITDSTLENIFSFFSKVPYFFTQILHDV